MKFNGQLCAVCSIICAVFIGSSDAAISEWTEPVISGKDGDAAAATTIAEDTAVGDTGVTLAVTADGTPAFSIVSQPTAGKLSINSGSGVISLETGFSFDFETESTYTIVVDCVESGAGTDTGTATVTLSITDVNEAPVFASLQYGATIADGSAEGASLTTVMATDQDTGDTITYAITDGNTNSDFIIGSTDGVIEVATGKTLAKSTTPGYKLIVEAEDNDGTPKTGTATVWVAFTTCGASAVVIGIMTLTLVAISMFV